MTDPVVLYKPADPEDPALLREAERLGCKPEDVGFKHIFPIFDEDPWVGWCIDGGYGIGTKARRTQSGDWLGEDDTLKPVRVYRSCDGQMFVESGDARHPTAGERYLDLEDDDPDAVWQCWDSSTHGDGLCDGARHRILILARWADEGEQP